LALLDDPGDDVALAPLEVTEDGLVLKVAQALHDDLARRRGRDPPEALGGVVELGPWLAPLWTLVLGGGEQLAVLAGPHHDVPGLAVQLDPGDAVAAVGAVVGHQQSLLDRRDEDVEA